MPAWPSSATERVGKKCASVESAIRIRFQRYNTDTNTFAAFTFWLDCKLYRVVSPYPAIHSIKAENEKRYFHISPLPWRGSSQAAGEDHLLALAAAVISPMTAEDISFYIQLQPVSSRGHNNIHKHKINHNCLFNCYLPPRIQSPSFIINWISISKRGLFRFIQSLYFCPVFCSDNWFFLPPSFSPFSLPPLKTTICKS